VTANHKGERQEDRDTNMGTLGEWARWLREKIEPWKAIIEVVFTFLLVVFSVLLYLTNRDYARTARLAERPWLDESFLTDANGNRIPFGNFTIAADQLIDIGIEYENFGQSPSPANEVAFKAQLGARPPDSEEEWRKSSPLPYFDCEGSTKKKYAGPLFPGDAHTHITRQDRNAVLSLSGPDFEDVKAGRRGIYLNGCIAYDDVEGGTHRSDFCLYFFHKDGNATGLFGYCPVGNDTN
jgi:hypothetical protein